jgi:hypothetical protein
MKFIYLTAMMVISIKTIQAQNTKTPTEVVQENLDFYNKRNLDGFMTSFTDSIALYTFGITEPVAKGKDAIRTLYKDLFDASPKLYSTILHRSIMGNKVIDHESIVGRKGSDVPIELVMIYEVSGERIARMTVIRK